MNFLDRFTHKPLPCSFPWCGSKNPMDAYVRCNRGHRFEWSCFKSYLATELEARNPLILCPLANCKGEISNCDLLPLLSPEQTKLLSRINIRKALGNDMVECSKCSMIFFVDQECLPMKRGQMLDCSNCQHRFCSTCSQASSSSARVDQCYDCTSELGEMKRKIVTALLEAHSVPCPKCKATWVKNLQCTHMTCSHCQTEFCYACGKSVSQLQLEDSSVQKLFQHNDGWPTRSGSCPLYLEEYRALYQDDVGVFRTRRFIPRKSKDGIQPKFKPEAATDIVCPSDPQLALEWFHIQRGITALNRVRQEIGESKWTQINTLWPNLLGSLEWANLIAS